MTTADQGDDMPPIQCVTASWSEWVAGTEPAVLATITHVQLKNTADGGGWYDVHISAYDADQQVVDLLASALGCPSNDGWEPPSGNSDHQWSVSVWRDGLNWHVTAVSPAVARTIISTTEAR